MIYNLLYYNYIQYIFIIYNIFTGCIILYAHNIYFLFIYECMYVCICVFVYIYALYIYTYMTDRLGIGMSMIQLHQLVVSELQDTG